MPRLRRAMENSESAVGAGSRPAAGRRARSAGESARGRRVARRASGARGGRAIGAGAIAPRRSRFGSAFPSVEEKKGHFVARLLFERASQTPIGSRRNAPAARAREQCSPESRRERPNDDPIRPRGENRARYRVVGRQGGAHLHHLATAGAARRDRLERRDAEQVGELALAPEGVVGARREVRRANHGRHPRQFRGQTRGELRGDGGRSRRRRGVSARGRGGGRSIERRGVARARAPPANKRKKRCAVAARARPARGRARAGTRIRTSPIVSGLASCSRASRPSRRASTSAPRARDGAGG